MNATREIPLQLLEDAIGLVHPDKHPAERAAKANRVTADLLALRPATRQKSGGLEGERLSLWVTARTLTASGIVTPEPAHLLSIRINSRTEGASLTLYDSLTATNPSTGVIKPNVETRYLHITHRVGVYAEIRGEMDLTFFFIRENQ